jgi:uncharacterized Zn-binding protein involved in type VI secretion
MPSVAVNPPKTPCTKGSSGVATATVPNVCKMPGPPAPFVPAPLPNIGKSGDSPKGYSTTVKIEGNEVAIRGASFNSMGDMASKGTGGGLVSSNTHGPTKFVAPGSLDVKIEGKNVQLLGDQMLNNCGPSGNPPNSATMAGLLQGPALVKKLNAIAKACNKAENKKAGYPPGKPSGAECVSLGKKKHKCCENKLKKAGHSNLDVEKSFDKNGKPQVGGPCKPDVSVRDASGRVTDVYDFKFNCKPKGSMSGRQRRKYKRAFKRDPKVIHVF